MTTASGELGDREAASRASGSLPRRRLLELGLGTAVGGAAALWARPSGALALGSPPVGPASVDDTVSTRPNVVGDWFEQVTVLTAPPPGRPPPVGVADRVPAISWMSALAALHAGGDQMSSRQRARFEDAAVATAVHDVLVELLPDQASGLEAVLRASLAAIPDGEGKQAGIRAGQSAAARMVADRQGDGLDPESVSPPFTPPPEAPGVYRLPPGATATQGAGLGRARPFLLGRADRFRPGPPPPLDTEVYRRGTDEVRRYGRDVDSERDEHQSDIAWLAPGMQFVPALRALVQAPGRPAAWKVSLLAAYTTATVDASIAVSDGKFAHLHWRPVTAIRAAGTDLSWMSYLLTPPNPDWPSGHGAGAGAAEQVLEHFTGPRTPVPFTASYRRGDGKAVSLDYPRGTRWSTLTQENVDARVWAGVHWRFSDEAGATLGRQIGDHNLRRLASMYHLEGR